MSMRVERSTLDQVSGRWSRRVDDLIIRFNGDLKVKDRFAKNKAKLEEKKVKIEII